MPARAQPAPTRAGRRSSAATRTPSGVPASGQSIPDTPTPPAWYFASELTLPPFNPAPPASLNYLPASAAAAQHMIADGPYQIQSYVPAKKIVFTRNPAWSASSDPIRKAYVDVINVTETGNQTTIQQILQTTSAAGGAEFDSFPPAAAEPGLVAQMKSGSKNFNLGPTFSTNPYVVFNEVSPNNGGALANVKVRQALSYGLDQ